MASAPHLADALIELVEMAAFPRDFHWNAKGLEDYNMEASARAFATPIKQLP